MTNRILFILLAMITTITASGQGIELVNLTISQKESKTIFIGVDNKFKVVGVENIQKTESSSPVYTTHLFREDTLVIRPHQVGDYLTLTFHKKDGPQQVKFNAKTISDVSPAIENFRSGDVVDKNKLIAQSKVILSPYKPDEIFFENYKVTSFEAHLGNQVFSVKGEKFTDDLVAAISKAKTGDKLMLTSVKAVNMDINKTINSRGQYSFELK